MSADTVIGLAQLAGLAALGLLVWLGVAMICAEVDGYVGNKYDTRDGDWHRGLPRWAYNRGWARYGREIRMGAERKARAASRPKALDRATRAKSRNKS